MLRRGPLDPSLPWRSFLTSPSTDGDSQTAFAALPGQMEVVGDEHNESTALGAVPAGFWPAPLERPTQRSSDAKTHSMNRGSKKQNDGRKLPGWLSLLESPPDEAPRQMYKLRRTDNSNVSAYADPQCEAEFWRFTLWRSRWEILGLLTILGILGVVRVADNTPLSVTQGVTGGIVLVMAGILAIAVRCSETREENMKQQRLLMRVVYRSVLVVGSIILLGSTIAGRAIVGGNCGYAARNGESNSEVCVRELPQDYCGFSLVVAVMIRQPGVVAIILFAVHAAAVFSFSFNSDFDVTSLALFGVVGTAVMAAFVTVSFVMNFKIRLAFDMAVHNMLVMWDTESQAVALVDLAITAMPSRVARRLQLNSMVTARSAIRTLAADSCDTAIAVAISLRAFVPGRVGHVLAVAACVSRMITSLDHAAHRLKIDIGGVFGDTYTLTSGLHGESSDSNGVVMLLGMLTALECDACAAGLRMPNRHDDSGVATAAVALSGSLQASLVGARGVRFVVCGPTMDSALKLSRLVPSGFCWLHESIASRSTVVQALDDASCSVHEDTVTIALSTLALSASEPLSQVESPSTMNPFRSLLSAEDLVSAAGASAASDAPVFLSIADVAVRHGNNVVQLTTFDNDDDPECVSPPAAVDENPGVEEQSMATPAAVAAVSDCPFNRWGTFKDPETESKFQFATRQEARISLLMALRFVGAFDAVSLLAVLAEFAADEALRSSVAIWRIISSSVLLAATFVACFVTVRLLLVRTNGSVVLSTNAVAALLFFVLVGSWTPLILDPRSFVANRPNFIALVASPFVAAALRLFGWVTNTVFGFVTVCLPIIIICNTVAADSGTAQLVVSLVAYAAISGFFAGMASRDGRRRYSDLIAMNAAADIMHANAQLLSDVATSVFPSVVVPEVLTVLAGDPSESLTTPSMKHHYTDLIVCHICCEGSSDHSAVMDLLTFAIAQIRPERDLSLVQVVGSQMLFAAGLARGNVSDAANHVMNLLSALLQHVERAALSSRGLRLVIAITLEEAQAVLTGTRTAMKYHLVGRAMRVASALLRAVAPPAVASSVPIVVATAEFIEAVAPKMDGTKTARQELHTVRVWNDDTAACEVVARGYTLRDREIGMRPFAFLDFHSVSTHVNTD